MGADKLLLGNLVNRQRVYSAFQIAITRVMPLCLSPGDRDKSCSFCRLGKPRGMNALKSGRDMIISFDVRADWILRERQLPSLPFPPLPFFSVVLFERKRCNRAGDIPRRFKARIWRGFLKRVVSTLNSERKKRFLPNGMNYRAINNLNKFVLKKKHWRHPIERWMDKIFVGSTSRECMIYCNFSSFQVTSDLNNSPEATAKTTRGLFDRMIHLVVPTRITFT